MVIKRSQELRTTTLSVKQGLISFNVMLEAEN